MTLKTTLEGTAALLGARNNSAPVINSKSQVKAARMKIFKYLSHSFSLVKKRKEGGRLSASPVSRIPQAQGSRPRRLSGSHHRTRAQAEAGTASGRLPEQSLGLGPEGHAALPTSPAYLSPTSPGTQTTSSGKTWDPGKLPAFFTEPPKPDSQSQAVLHRWLWRKTHLEGLKAVGGVSSIF